MKTIIKWIRKMNEKRQNEGKSAKMKKNQQKYTKISKMNEKKEGQSAKWTKISENEGKSVK